MDSQNLQILHIAGKNSGSSSYDDDNNTIILLDSTEIQSIITTEASVESMDKMGSILAQTGLSDASAVTNNLQTASQHFNACYNPVDCVGQLSTVYKDPSTGPSRLGEPDIIQQVSEIQPLPKELPIPNLQDSSTSVVDEPLYVNAKQYHRIMKRREARAKLEASGKIPKDRKKYQYESRHVHAVKRARNGFGRFLGSPNAGIKEEGNPNKENKCQNIAETVKCEEKQAYTDSKVNV